LQAVPSRHFQTFRSSGILSAKVYSARYFLVLGAVAMSLSHRMLKSLSRRTIWAGIFLAAVLLPWQSGCVQRRMTIRTNPPGALVYVDDYEIGTTPVSTDFTYYGTRKIRIVKDGYETLTVMQPIPAPWYQFPPADFITENFVPGKIRDQRLLDYQLKPQMVVPTDQLLSRAEGLRRDSLVTPASAIMPQPNGLAPNIQQGAPIVPTSPNTLPGTIPNTAPYSQPNTIPPPSVNQPPNGYQQPNINTTPNNYQQPNAYPQPNTSIPPGTSGQPNAYSQPTMLTPPALNPSPDIGGQGVHPLPPR
jgi:hypothetical protein